MLGVWRSLSRAPERCAEALAGKCGGLGVFQSIASAQCRTALTRAAVGAIVHQHDRVRANPEGKLVKLPLAHDSELRYLSCEDLTPCSI